jgi:signal transduction histidine kinase
MLGWIGFGLIRSEEQNAKRQIATLAEGRLLEIIRSVDDVMSSQYRTIKQKLEPDSRTPDASLPEYLMSMERTEPHVRRIMWVSARGQLLHPQSPLSTNGNEFLLYNELSLMARQRPPVPIEIRRQSTNNELGFPTASRIQSSQRNDLQIGAKAQKTISQTSPSTSSPEPENSRLNSPWQVSYFDEGLQLVFWNVRPDGSATGCWLERARWIADLVAILPDVDPDTTDGATALVDENGTVVYRWGASSVAMDRPIAEAPLKEPLAAWRLRYFLPENQSATSTWLRFWPWALALSTVAFALLALGLYVTLATTQQLRLADQRVSFVGQVSHELRTPLTNIRLYAEMASRDLTLAEPAVHRIAERLQVIDSESKRLSRLISGVLEFMQSKNKELALTWQNVVPDDTVRQVLTQCAISLERSGIVVTTMLTANRLVEMDSDALEQILVNLISNVEKYAASGKSMHVSTSIDDDILTLQVRDAGPGIPPRFSKRIFQPFFRMDDANTAPSGTGLGLTIARNAAKRHGGTLDLLTSQDGAHFRLQLRVRPVTEIGRRAIS